MSSERNSSSPSLTRTAPQARATAAPEAMPRMVNALVALLAASTPMVVRNNALARSANRRPRALL